MRRIATVVICAGLLLTSCGRGTPGGKVELRLEADADVYKISLPHGASAPFKVVDGKIQYEDIKVSGPVVSVFRGKEQQAQFHGVLQTEDIGMGSIGQHIQGQIKGTCVVVGDANVGAGAQGTSTHGSRILDEYPKGRYLVEGTVEFKDGKAYAGK